MTLPFKDYLIGAGVLAVIGGGIGYTLHERSVGALNEKLKNTEATAHVQLDSVARRSQDAVQAASQAQAAQTQALRLVAAGEALRAKTDSVARSATDERARSERVLADSLATVSGLRDQLAAQVRSSTSADSANAAQQGRDRRTIAQLLSVVSADSLALTAEQRRSQSLQALTETYAKEITLLKKAQPSTFGNVVRVVGWAGAGFALGHILK